jgi:hypothetical protein
MLLPRLLGFACVVCACGGDDPATVEVDPTDVTFGDTALVVVVNPEINDANRRTVPMPGATRMNLVVTSDDGIADTTGADGIAVLAPLTAGMRTFTITGGGVDATFTVMLTQGALREVALAADGARAELMANIDYKSDQAFEITPGMTNPQVNDALKVSDRVVFIRGGTYVGDLDFSGSRVTLFGEGVLGGSVVLQGNITISGSDSRLRGTKITGNVTMPASGLGLSFSRIDGTANATGSDAKLLANSLCGGATITGSGSLALGNTGAPPLGACM